MSDESPDMEIIGHLLAVRTVLSACMTNVDAALAAVGIAPEKHIVLNEPAPCEHPLEKRVDYTGAGSSAARWVCGLCGYQGGAW